MLSCPRFDLVEREWRHEAATLLHQLLTQHRCLVSVELNEHMLSGSPEPIAQICDALSSGTTLRKLTLSLPFRPSWICPWYHARPVFDGYMSPHHFDTYSEGPYTRLDHSFLKGFADFLAITRSLTTLDISQLPLLESNAGDIFRRLKGNTTVTTLSVNTLILSPYVSRNDVGFADYMRENRTLQSLSVMALAEHARRDFTWLIGALFTRNTLSELNMIQFRLNMEMHKLIASHLEKNQTLRSFNLVSCKLQPSWQPRDTSPYQIENFGNVSANIRPWIVALIKNKTLVELTMNFECFNMAECRCFIKALASNVSLKKVTVEWLEHTTAAEICRTLRENGVCDRFSVDAPLVVEEPVVALTECKELHCIKFDSDIFDSDVYGSDHESKQLRTTLFLLPASTHVTSFCLNGSDEPLSKELSSLLSQYIVGTTVLRELVLNFGYVSEKDVDRADRTLVQALSLNRSIRKLSIKGCWFDETGCEMLADVVQYSRTIYDFCCEVSTEESRIALIQKLLSNIRSNYTLVAIYLWYFSDLCNDWLTLMEITWRNFSLVERAAQFVMGNRHKYCAAAIELVQFSPRLVEKVKELASVNEKEAVLQIKTSLECIAEMDDFMRMAGVVKYSVACHDRDDGQKQLVDLNLECWLHLRQYINVGDIRDEQ